MIECTSPGTMNTQKRRYSDKLFLKSDVTREKLGKREVGRQQQKCKNQDSAGDDEWMSDSEPASDDDEHAVTSSSEDDSDAPTMSSAAWSITPLTPPFPRQGSQASLISAMLNKDGHELHDHDSSDTSADGRPKDTSSHHPLLVKANDSPANKDEGSKAMRRKMLSLEIPEDLRKGILHERETTKRKCIKIFEKRQDKLRTLGMPTLGYSTHDNDVFDGTLSVW